MKLYPFQQECVEKLEKVISVLIGDDMGLGKSMPISEPVLTPNGFVPIGSLKLGDAVIGSSGKNTIITGVFPQGTRPVVKVKFSDKTYSRCDIEHLWTVTTSYNKRSGRPYETYTTKQLISNGIYDSAGNRKYFLPMVKPVEFAELHQELDPYFLGVLLGDGNLSQPANVVVSTDLEIIQNIDMPNGVTKTHYGYDGTSARYGFSGLLSYTRKLKLQGCKSEDKFIPNNYKHGTVDSRIALLQGLLDTDGTTANSRGKPTTTIEYGTTSRQLASDVDFIVRSLGGTTSTTIKFPTYKYKGNKLDGKPFYRMIVKLPSGIVPFRLRRKLSKWVPRTKYEPTKSIVNIIPDGDEECVCIAVLAKDSLYVTRDFTLTHNTHEAIALDLKRRLLFPNHKLKTLIVCPLSVVSTWTIAWLQWAPHLRVLPINNKDRSYFINELQDDVYDVFICHWPVLRLMTELEDIIFFHVIADEAHALQNRKSKQSVSLKKLKAGYKSALTGTPAFDKPDDLWSILNWLYPKYWSSYWKYWNEHIIFDNFNGYRTIVGVNNPEKLQREMSGFYIRRRKEEVLTDLPDKYYSEIKIELGPQQRRAYNSMRDDMLAWVGEHEAEPVVAPIIIAQLTRLQQFACAFAEFDPIKNKMMLSEPSTKLDAVIDILDSTGSQVVVFSNYSQVIDLLCARLEKKGITYGKYVGKTPNAQRSQIVSDFQDGKLQVFAGTISAGGVGINLFAADKVIFIDRNWSNALNLQAEDRLHRMGQQNAVQVIDIIADKTIDAKRIRIIKQKWSWVRKLLGEGEVDEWNEEDEEE